MHILVIVLSKFGHELSLSHIFELLIKVEFCKCTKTILIVSEIKVICGC